MGIHFSYIGHTTYHYSCLFCPIHSSCYWLEITSNQIKITVKLFLPDMTCSVSFPDMTCSVSFPDVDMQIECHENGSEEVQSLPNGFFSGSVVNI